MFVAAALLARVLPPALGGGLALATVLLLPGFAVVSALRPQEPFRPYTAIPLWAAVGVTVDGAALAATFAAHRSLRFAIALATAMTAAALVVAILRRRPRAPDDEDRRERRLAAGLVAGVVPFALAAERLVRIETDQPFHLGRIRKLVELPSLSVSAMNELVAGDPHPGYLLPAWHGVLAFAARIGGIDPIDLYRAAPLLLVPLAALAAAGLVRAAGLGVRVATAAGAATVVSGLLGRGDSRLFALLENPPTATAAILLPAAAIGTGVFWRVPTRTHAALLLAAASAAALVHVTYLPIAVAAAAGPAVVAAGRRTLPLRRTLAALALVFAPVAAVTVIVLPYANDVRAAASAQADVNVERFVALGRVEQVAGMLVADPGRLISGGPLALAALALVGLAWRAGRAGAIALPATVAVCAVALLPPLFTVLASVLSLAQALRIGIALPVGLLLATGAVGGRTVRPVWFAVAGAASFLLTGVPAAVTAAIAAAGLVVALVALLRRHDPGDDDGSDRPAALRVAACAATVGVLALPTFAPRVVDPPAERLLGPAIVDALRTLPRGTVVGGDVNAIYLVPAYVSLPIAAAPPRNVAATSRNRPYQRFSYMRRLVKPSATTDERRTLLRALRIDALLLTRDQAAQLGAAYAPFGARELARDDGHVLVALRT